MCLERIQMKWDFFFGIVVFPLGFTDGRCHSRQGMLFWETMRPAEKKKKRRTKKKGLKIPPNVRKTVESKERGKIRKERKKKCEIEWSLKEIMKSSTWLFRNKQRQYCSIRATKPNKNIRREGRTEFSLFFLFSYFYFIFISIYFIFFNLTKSAALSYLYIILSESHG